MPTRSTSSSSNGSSPSSTGGNGGREGAAGLSAYEKVMGRMVASSTSDVAGSGSNADNMRDDESAGALSSRLAGFRKWLSGEANVHVHPAVCIVNGEATDGTKNAPVLVVDRDGGSSGASGGAAAAASSSASSSAVVPVTAAGGVNAGRVGAVDWEGDQKLYDRTMGCQVRSTREIKTGEVMMTMPRGAFITPDLVASSDAGRAVLACCQSDPAPEGEARGFWDAFENTTEGEAPFSQKVARSTAPQLLVKILQERKRAEANFNKRIRLRDEATTGEDNNDTVPFELIPQGGLSTRAPLLAFLIQQRFADSAAPQVVSDSRETNEQFQRAVEDSSAIRTAARIVRPPASPDSFAPYARTLPSFVSIPLCWRRSELALLASSLPGLTPLQDAAARTLHLASEFVTLLEAGVLERFPATFPKGMFTWERWVWAAAVVSSRALPASAYVDADVDVHSFVPPNPLEFQSPAHIWSELGVLIPLLDMLNHERDAHQVTWEPNAPEVAASSNGADSEVTAGHPPRAIIHKKVKKGSELFCCYGDRSNSFLIQQYGFSQLSNACDEVRIGWGLGDAVGHLDPPEDYVSLIPDDAYQRFLVFETTDEAEVKKWWTDDRLALLGKEAFSKSNDGVMESLKNGKKMFALAHSDGTFYPILLTVLVVATMPKIELQKFVGSKKESLVLSKRHQQVLRSYMAFFFSRKLEKLLQNVSAGLKDHFNTGKLWTQAAKGGLRYAADESDKDGYLGWQSFFDTHVYRATMEVEDHYYAMGTESCVLALFDGNLRALQNSLDTVCDDDKFAEEVLRPIEELGFGVATDKDDGTMSKDGTSPNSDKKSPKNRKRSKQKSSASTTNDADSIDRPVAVKIHVGNLSFTTTPSDMYDYFSSLYGKDNVLECHIPVERETGRSRGFGFVTMPEPVAYRVLETTQKHEIGGRLIKLARSNSAGTNPAGRSQQSDALAANERCSKCGYRPKYCTCGGAESRSRSDQTSHDRPRDVRSDDRDPAYYAHKERDRDRDRYRDRGYRDYPPPSDHYSFEREDRYGRAAETYSDDRYRSSSRRERYDDDRGRSPRDYSPERRGRSPDEEYYYRRSRRDDDDRRSIRKRSRSASRSRSRSRDRSRRRKSRKRSRSYSPMAER
jgi:RNA recognition motif-containing protein